MYFRVYLGGQAFTLLGCRGELSAFSLLFVPLFANVYISWHLVEDGYICMIADTSLFYFEGKHS